MQDVKLVLPSEEYKLSFLEALEEYQREGLYNYQNIDPDWLNKNFEGFIKQMHQESLGKDLPKGYVQHTVFWLVDSNKYLGRVDIRHELNEFLLREGGHIGYDVRPSERMRGLGKLALKLALVEAKKIGLKKVLVTCNIDNLGSKKIILANGGEFEDQRAGKNRYWIVLSK